MSRRRRRRTPEERDLDIQAARIAENRARAPQTCALAEVLFDRSRELGNPEDLEHLAIAVDGDAQRGVDYGPDTMSQVVQRASQFANAAQLRRAKRQGA